MNDIRKSIFWHKKSIFWYQEIQNSKTAPHRHVPITEGDLCMFFLFIYWYWGGDFFYIFQVMEIILLSVRVTVSLSIYRTWLGAIKLNCSKYEVKVTIFGYLRFSLHGLWPWQICVRGLIPLDTPCILYLKLNQTHIYFYQKPTWERSNKGQGEIFQYSPELTRCIFVLSSFKRLHL